MHILIRYLHLKYKNRATKFLTILFRTGLLMTGTVCVMILILVAIPQFSCQSTEGKGKDADYLIILGAGLKNGDQLSYSLRTRLDKGLEVLQNHPDLKVIVSGGQGKNERLSEAQAMRNYLINRGIPRDQIILEDESKSTYENLIFSKKKMEESLRLLEPSTEALQHNLAGADLWPGPDRNSKPQVVIVSSDFHMFRIGFMAKKLDLRAQTACSASYLSLKTNYMIREIPAVINDALGNILK